MKNWKTILIIASLPLSVNLTACGKKDKAVEIKPSPMSSTPAPSAQTTSIAGASTAKMMMKKIGLLPTSTAVIDKALKSLEWGNIAFNAPEEMNIEETKTIELVLSETKSIQELQSSLKSSMRRESPNDKIADNIESAKIKISGDMEATLVGTEFKIESSDPKEQAISGVTPTKWNWKVTPKKDGVQDLHLQLSTYVPLSDRKIQYVISTFDKHIKVKVSTGHRISTFISTNWQWLWASILVPLSPFAWNWYQKKKEKKSIENLPSGDLSG